jgi:hypothetical protein
VRTGDAGTMPLGSTTRRSGKDSRFKTTGPFLFRPLTFD